MTTALALLIARVEAAESERAEQWRAAREAQAQRDVAKAACAQMREERDQARLTVQNAPNDLETYDAGLLGDGGGGDVGWWQDYIRAELDRAEDHYQQQYWAILALLRAVEAGA